MPPVFGLSFVDLMQPHRFADALTQMKCTCRCRPELMCLFCFSSCLCFYLLACRFDHHQKTFHDTLSEEAFQTRLSSAGLVYRHFGRQILKQLVQGTTVPEDVVDKKLYAKVYEVRCHARKRREWCRLRCRC